MEYPAGKLNKYWIIKEMPEAPPLKSFALDINRLIANEDIKLPSNIKKIFLIMGLFI